jgi:hypothetical protein
MAIGVAAITRPEAAAIAGIVGIGKIKQGKQLARIVAGFAIVFAVNVAVLSWSSERFILVPKTGNIGAGAKSAVALDEDLELPDSEQGIAGVPEGSSGQNLVAYYIERLPGEVMIIVRQLLPVLIALALYGMWRRRSLALMAPLAFIIVYPLVTPRSDDRFVLPYVPFLLLFALIGLESVAKRYRPLLFALVALSAVALPFVNSSAFDTPDNKPLVDYAKDVADRVGGMISPGDRVADRKPYLPFYTDAEFYMIPLAPYDRTIQSICDAGVRYVSLHRHSVETWRPALRPLLYDEAVIAGELRLKQVLVTNRGEAVLEVVRRSDPLTWRELVSHGDDSYAPAFSPDGSLVAFQSVSASGDRRVRVLDTRDGRLRELAGGVASVGQVCWSPDGRYIAFSGTAHGNPDIMILGLQTGDVTRFTSSDAADHSPSWAPNGEWIAFTSNRSGQDEIWMKAIASGEARRLTEGGGNAHPAFDPTGNRIAWSKVQETLAILNLVTGEVVSVENPHVVAFAPAWSPDGRYLAVTAYDWGSWDIYLVRADGKASLLLTKDLARQGMPTWSPDGRALVINSEHGEKPNLWVLTGLEPYLARLDDPGEVYTFEQ